MKKLFEKLIYDEIKNILNEQMDFNRQYSYYPPGFIQTNLYEKISKLREKNKKIFEDLDVEKESEVYWALFYNIYEFLEKHIDRLDLAYKFLKTKLEDDKLDALEYFYEYIVDNKDELFETCEIISEYNQKDSFLSDYETAKEFAYENIDDVAECFDSYHENSENIHHQHCYEKYIDLISLYVDKYNELKNENVVTIYRLIKLNNLNDLDVEDIGKHWSFEKEGVGDYGSTHPKQTKGPHSKSYILTANVNPQDIDWVYGFYSFIWYGEDQWECALNEGTNVQITAINDESLETKINAKVGKH